MGDEVGFLKSEVARYRKYFGEADQKLAETWELIDRMIPYIRDAPPTDKGEQIDWYIDKVDLLAEIEQKRKFHG